MPSDSTTSWVYVSLKASKYIFKGIQDVGIVQDHNLPVVSSQQYGMLDTYKAFKAFQQTRQADSSMYNLRVLCIKILYRNKIIAINNLKFEFNLMTKLHKL